MKIAVIGSGISGLGAAYLLSRKYQVSVFEKADSIGGHTATKTIEVNNKTYHIDTGFIVFNDWTYPNFKKLLKELKVDYQDTQMSFSVKSELTGLEYAGSNLDTLFAQKKNILSPTFLRMLRDIVHFNKHAIADLESGKLKQGITLKQYLDQFNYGDLFISHYLIPMGSAIWSASLEDMQHFPALFFVRFFKNHGLLSIKNRPQWHVIKGGSHSYLKPLCKPFADQIFTNTHITAIRREAEGVVIELQTGAQHYFDQVVFACHSDQALELLQDASELEHEILGAIPYEENEVVLHTDTSLLPSNKKAWASWNYGLNAQQQQAVLTYNMNILQGIESDTTFCVSLNTTQNIDAGKILGRYFYSHPQFSLASVAAAERWQEINGVNRSWFCGAYWANGFHEDGFSSAVRVAQKLGVNW